MLHVVGEVIEELGMGLDPVVEEVVIDDSDIGRVVSQLCAAAADCQLAIDNAEAMQKQCRSNAEAMHKQCIWIYLHFGERNGLLDAQEDARVDCLGDIHLLVDGHPLPCQSAEVELDKVRLVEEGGAGSAIQPEADIDLACSKELVHKLALDDESSVISNHSISKVVTQLHLGKSQEAMLWVCESHVCVLWNSEELCFYNCKLPKIAMV